MLRKNLLITSSEQKISYIQTPLNQDSLNKEAARFSVSSVSKYMTAYHNAEDCHLAVNVTANVNKTTKYTFIRIILLNLEMVTNP